VPRLEDEDDDERKDNEQKKEYALPPASVLLVPVEHGTKNRRDREEEINQTLIAINYT
jgi:hypothetical protein